MLERRRSKEKCGRGKSEQPPLIPILITIGSALWKALGNVYVQTGLGIVIVGYALFRLFSVDATHTLILAAGSALLGIGCYGIFRSLNSRQRK